MVMVPTLFTVMTLAVGIGPNLLASVPGAVLYTYIPTRVITNNDDFPGHPLYQST